MRKAVVSSLGFFMGLSVLIAPVPLPAQALAPGDVPAPLRPWVDWVLFGREWVQCAPRTLDAEGDSADGRRCVWPATLELDLGARSGQFSQKLTVDAPALVALPGDEKHWPLDVRVDGQPGMVSDRDGVPTLELKGGEHTVSGRFAWDALPDALVVPDDTGLVRLRINGRAVRFPEREDGSVYLRSEEEVEREAREDDRLDVLVHRRVVDDVPLKVLTRIELFVSGKNREVVIGPALLSGFVAMSLKSPIPARLEPSGLLRAQVRPGTWAIELDARHPQKPAELELGPPSETWVPEEVWVFEALPPLRTVELEGAEPLDPQQTRLPDDWKRFPTYRVRPSEKLRLVEKQRGDSDPQPDRLTLSRDVWLDFDGGGYTVRDFITGQKQRPGRLEMQAPLELGRVAIAGTDQFITKLAGSDRAGVEVKRGALSVHADSRLPTDDRDFPIIGWATDVTAASATLHLPPGWRLFTATGADEVPGSWFRRWSLVELFVVLVASFGFARLFGVRAGIIACVALVLSVPEPLSPSYTWLAALVIETLVRVMPLPRLARVLRWTRIAVWLLLLGGLLEFALREVRIALYPALEHEYSGVGTTNDQPKPVMAEPEAEPSVMGGVEEGVAAGVVGGVGHGQSVYGGGPADEEMEKQEARPRRNVHAKKAKEKIAAEDADKPALAPQAQTTSRIQRKAAVSSFAYSQKTFQVDPKIVVQTGPGLPTWNWNTYDLRFSGPVTKEQRVRFFLLSPVVSSILGLLRVLLSALLFAITVAGPLGRLPRGLSSRLGIGAAVALMLLAPVAAHAQAAPTDDMLEELRERLSAPPRCAPECVSIGRMLLEAQGATLRLRLEVTAAAKTSVPLPAAEAQWMPERVLLDGREASGLARDDSGSLWLRVPAGAHQVVLEGSLPERDSVQIPLPLRPHFVEARTSGWQLDGLHEDGQADDNLQLGRTEARKAENKAQALQQGALPPFVTLTRKLELGLNWQMETTVSRQTPLGAAVVLEVPLVEGESVTTSEVRVEGGKALINMGASQSEISWRSVLRERPDIVLKAKPEAAWTEVWQLDASPVWHVEVQGFPAIHGQGEALPEWRPWPNEQVTFSVSRPEGAQGQTVTIDASTVDVRPGARATDVTLRLSMRSSRGGQHAVKLAANTAVQSVSVNGVSQPMRFQGGEVTVPVSPGAQSVEIVWREPLGVSLSFASPEIDVGLANVNAELKLGVPRDRWLLLARGDGVGPAILFWGTLLVLLLVSLGLGRFSGTPLRARHWFLLGLGLTQLDFSAAFVVFAWFLLLAYRKKWGASLEGFWFDAMQLALVGWTMAAAGGLIDAIRHGLVVQPDMQVVGNGSYDGLLRFFSDRAGRVLPRASFLSLPLFVYRALMLAWALWLARALLSWTKWAWGCMSDGSLYKPFEWRFWRRLRERREASKE